MHSKLGVSAVRLAPKTLTAQLVKCGQQQSWREAVKLLKYAIGKMEANVLTYSATISTCGKGQQWFTSVSLLREMQQ